MKTFDEMLYHSTGLDSVTGPFLFDGANAIIASAHHLILFGKFKIGYDRTERRWRS